MVKVSKEKVMRERAREAGDKKMEKLKKLRQENRERAKCINERKNKQLKTIMDKNWKSRERYKGGCKP